MIGKTLAFYFARRFAVIVLGIFLFFFTLIGIITYLEFFMRSLNSEQFDPIQIMLLAAYRVPAICEDLLPFTVLFGSIAAFVVANRRLEVVVARAAGISAWQFLLPACVIGLLIGIAGTTLYNPASVVLRGWSNEIAARLATDPKAPVVEESAGPMWLRQSNEGRESILGAVQTFNQGLRLSGVTAFVFDESGAFRERVDAAEGEYVPGEWRLSKATITAPSRQPQQVDVYTLPTALGPHEVRQAFDELEGTSFWELPRLIETAQRAGIPTGRYELRYNTLLSRPIVLLAMVLIAAIVSLRFSRSRELGSMILAGVAVGFMLYVVSKIARDLGSGGVVPPLLAAWLPAIVTLLVGATVLLHLEDG